MNTDKFKLNKGKSEENYYISESVSGNIKQETNNIKHDIKISKKFLELWRFTQSEVLVLKSLIELNKSATCLEISQIYSCYQNTVYKALGRLEKKGIVKKNNMNRQWYFIGREELEKILYSRVKDLIKKLFNKR